LKFLRELPALVGLVIGLLLMWWLGGAFVLNGVLEGTGWAEFINSAWTFGTDKAQAANDFRGHLHPLLVSAIGDQMGSYGNAALLVTSLSFAAMVFSAALAGRALAGPWAGGGAAALVGLTAGHLDAAHWVTTYPLLGGLTCLAMGLAVATARWGRPELALLTGLVSAAMMATDPRGVAFAVVAGALVLCGMLKATSWRRWALFPLFVVMLPLSEAGKPDALKQLDRERIRTIQKGVIQRWIDLSGDHELVRACAPVVPDGLLEARTMAGPCGRELVRFNFRDRLPKHLPLGHLGWLGLLGVLIPLRRDWRSSVISAVFFVGYGGALLVMLAASPAPPRYLLQFGLLFALPATVGLERLVRLVPGRVWIPEVLAGAAISALLGLSWSLDPSERGGVTDLKRNPWYGASNDAAALVRAHLKADDAILDCSGHAILVHLAPRRRPVREWNDWWQWTLSKRTRPVCLDWVAQGEPGRLVVLRVQPRDEVEHRLESETSHWEELGSNDTVRILRATEDTP